MSEPSVVDVVVVGGGPGGEAAAVHLARGGARTVLVERELVGGECPYWGCMPSKALLRPGQEYDEGKRVPGVAEALVGPLDVESLLARRDEVVGHLEDGRHAERVLRHGVELVRGHGRLTGERRVEVHLKDGDRRSLVAQRAVVLAPGTHAAMPDIDGLAEARPWTNREATLVRDVPERLTILGGGVISVELAQAYASLGCTVTIVEAAPRLIGREEPQASALVTESLQRSGITVRCGSTATSVRRGDDGTVTLTVDGEREITSDELLVATGRRGNVGDLGLDCVDVEPDRHGFVRVLDCMHHPDHAWLYVVGDANGRALLTHAAAYQARIAARNILGIHTDCVEDDVAAPRIVYTEPTVAAVGSTLHAALDAGVNAKAFDRDPQRTAGGSFVGRGTEGFARLVVDMDSGCIIGATFAAADISELLHSATVAIVGGVPIERLRHCVAPFPTRSEVWVRLVELLDRDPALRART